jgi:DNA-3-methyladenine glycosylase
MEEITQIDETCTENLGTLVGRNFFLDPPARVAPRLLGKLLVTASGAAGRIVEVEAYLGPHCAPADPAAHAFRGPTQRNSVLFGPAGHAYVYAIYGRYFCMNISCEPEGRAGCVLLRALVPILGLSVLARNRGLETDATPTQLTSGPSRLCQALGITRAAHNGVDLLDASSPLQVRDDGWTPEKIRVGARIGIKQAADWPLRFFVEGEPCVSGPKRLNAAGKRIAVLG